MARINWSECKELEKNRNSVHDVVRATYTTFEDGGNRYVQIDTYGKSNRNMPEKISQSFQLDKDSAIKLIDLLEKKFEL